MWEADRDCVTVFTSLFRQFHQEYSSTDVNYAVDCDAATEPTQCNANIVDKHNHGWTSCSKAIK